MTKSGSRSLAKGFYPGAYQPRIGHLEKGSGASEETIQEAPKDAEALLDMGDSPRDNTLPAIEHAAFTTLPNASQHGRNTE